MASRLDVAKDDDDDDDDSDSDSDSPPASSFTKNGQEPLSNAHIHSEQDENDVEMNSASASNDDGGSSSRKQEAPDDERGKSQGSEVKVEEH